MAEETLTPPLKDPNLLLACGMAIFVALSTSTVFPILPLLSSELNIPLHEVSLVIALCTAPGIILTPVSGFLVDKFGRKEVLLPSLAIYTVAGTACAFAPDITTLITLRFFQGVGAAPFGVLYTTIIGDLYSGKERIRNMGYVTSTLSVCTAVMPLLGGLLGEISWRLVFFLPATAGIYGYFVIRYLHLPKVSHNKPVKMYVSDVWRVIQKKQVHTLYVVNLLANFILWGPLLIFLPKLIDMKFTTNPSHIGGIFIILAICSALVSSQLLFFNRFLERRKMIAFGFILYGFTMAIIPGMPGYWWLLIPMAICGMGRGLVFSTLMSLLSEATPTTERGAIMALVISIIRTAQSIAPYIFMLPYMLGGMDAVYFCAVLVAIAGCLTTIRFVAPEQTRP